MPSTLRVLRDLDPMSPRDWDNLGIILTWHRRYRLGDVQPKVSPSEWLSSRMRENAVILPVYMYDHSGLSLSTTPFSCRWDSGQLGYIYAPRAQILETYKVSRISKKLRKTVESALRAEVLVYHQYLQGDAWGYVFEKEGKETDSCWGFFGETLEETGMKDSVPAEALPLLEQAWADRA